MKFVVFSLLFFLFQTFVWADEGALNKKKAFIHIEHLDHIPHHPKGKEPTDKTGHDGIIYPRKRIKKGILESA